MSGYYNQPPQGFPPQQGYGDQQPPPHQHGQHGYYGLPQGQYQQPPLQQGGFQQPSPPQGYGYGQPQGQFPPQHQGFGAPPHGQHAPPQSYGPPAPPSLGYDLNIRAQGDARGDAQALRKAMKGFGTDEAVLINVLTKPDPLQMVLLKQTYQSELRRDLEKDVSSETSGHFRDALMALLRGPLMQDVYNLNNAIKGLGTKESVLNDVLLNRSNADMRAIKQHYHQTCHRTLESDVAGDLSMKTETLFKMILSATRAEENSPIIPDQISRDVHDLYSATRGLGTDQIPVCNVLAHRSDGQIRAIAHEFEARYSTSLEKKIKSEFSGHMEDALSLIVRRACDRAMTDAVQLEDTMAGMGTKDVLLLNRIVRMHWDRLHMDQVKRAYKHRFGRDLITRVRGETSGDYERCLVACLN